MSEKSLKFGELVSFLARNSPNRLQALRSEFPREDDAVFLQPGQVQGESSKVIGCAVTQQALKEFGPAAAALRIKLRKRLAWSWRFDLAAKFAAACGSGGALGVLAAGISDSVNKALLASSVALFGSLCGLLFSYFQRDETSGSLTDMYNKLILSLVAASDLERRLPELCAAGDSAELRELLAKANETARDLNELILRIS